MDFIALIILGLAAIGLVGTYIISSSAKSGAAERLRALSIANVDQMSGVEFEHYAAALLENEGFYDVRVTPATGDNGVDIVAARGDKRYAIQAKRYKGTVSRRAVSDAVAGMVPYSCNASMVITTGFLSFKAMDFARAHTCEVVNRDLLAEWIIRFQGKGRLHLSTELLAESSLALGSGADANEADRDGSVALVSPDRSTRPLDGKTVSVPGEIANQIKQYARTQHPGDFATMEYVIDEGLKAYRELRGISVPDMPSEVYSRICNDATLAHPADYSTQLYAVQEQIDSFRSLQRVYISGVPDEILRKIVAKADERHPNDFATQLYVVNEQARAFVALEQMG